eukprot:symbB.v1.2.031632.t1/scaffold3692.1/size51916/2
MLINQWEILSRSWRPYWAFSREEALEGNLGELQSELTKLQKGLRLAKTYLNDSTTELENLRAEVAKSNLSQELKVAEKKYEELQAEAEKVSLEENRLWKETLEQEEL